MARSAEGVRGSGPGAVRPGRRIERKRHRSAPVAAQPWTRHPPSSAPVLPLLPLIAEYTATFGSTWGAATRSKHAGDFARYLAWLDANGLPATTASLDFPPLLAYVEDLRARPRVTGVWRGAPDALARTLAAGSTATLSANTVSTYVRPLRSLVIWLVDEGILAANAFRRSRRRAALNPLLPYEETPTKSATLDDLRALERGCAGEMPLDLRDRAMASVLMTTAARNSSVRLLRIADVDVAREVILFRRAKGGKTLEIALHPATRDAILAYLDRGRPALVAPLTAHGEPDPGWLFVSTCGDQGVRPLLMNATSLMLTRRYHAGGGTLPYFGSHRIRHATATLLVNNGMPLDEVSRYLGHSSTDVTRRYARQTPDALGRRAADALLLAGVTSR
jgi:integrase